MTKRRPASTLEEQRAVLEQIEALEAERARLHARGLALRAELALLWGDERSGFAEMELAGTALVGQYRAARELDDATRFADCFPKLAELLDAGAVYVPVAEAVLAATRTCTPEVQALVDVRLCAQLVGRNVTDCRRLISSTILAVEAELDPQLTADRLESARKGARVWVSPGSDGMPAIGAVLEAVAGRRWALDFEQLVKALRTLDAREGRERTVQELQAEVFAKLPGLVLELVRAARDGRLTELSELADLDEQGVAELRELVESLEQTVPGEDAVLAEDPVPATTEIRLESDPFDEGLCARDPWHELVWIPGEEPADAEVPEGPPPGASAAQDAADRSSWTRTAPGPDRKVEDLLLRCLEMPLASPAVLNLHLPMATVLDLTHAPGLLEGHGPLGAARIRQLLPTARLREVYVDEHSGVPLGASPQPDPVFPGQAGLVELARRLRPVTLVDEVEPQHDPSAELARFVKLRDQRCSGPGCTMPASRCDLDHETAHPAGPTAEWNLADRSRRCHGAKHHGWAADRSPDGTTSWLSPTGRTYTSHPQWTPPPAVPRPPFQLHAPSTRFDLEIETAHAG